MVVEFWTSELLVIYAALTPWAAFSAWPDADEPHYLLLTHSLWADGDFDLSNNYARQDYKAYYPPDIPAQDHHTLRQASGAEYPIHDVGVSILLVPGYAIGGRLGAMIEMNIVASVLSLGLFEVGTILSMSVTRALYGWALFTFVSPLVTYSSQIYPEVPGAALAIWAFWFFWRFQEEKRLQSLVWSGVLLGLMPWLSVRYWIVIGPAIAVMVLFVIVRSTTNRARIAAVAGLASPLLATLCAFAIFDSRLYGTILPNAGYVLFVPTMTERMFVGPLLFRGLLGLMFDRAYGLFATAPVYIVAMAGVMTAIRRHRWLSFAMAASITAYVLFAAPNRWWYGGWAPPGRYIFVSIALMVPFGAAALGRVPSRLAIVLAVAWSTLISLGLNAFPLTRYTLWTRSTSALGDLVFRKTHIEFDAIFPSIIRHNAGDYALAFLWTAAAVTLVWWWNRPVSGAAVND